MAKGNDGNYLQHCIEIEAASRLVKHGAKGEGRLHIALTHGMEPFEKLDKPNNNVCHKLLYDALCEASRKPQRDKRLIVEAYRKICATKERYPNTAELLREVIGGDNLSGGITECNWKTYKNLAVAWHDSKITVANWSWRKQTCKYKALACPKGLDRPWLFSMDPMSYEENGDSDDDRLHRSDIDRLACTLGRYVGSRQPGIASLFVYNMTDQKIRQFWEFVDLLKNKLGMSFRFYGLPYNDKKWNLASLLYTDFELMSDFIPHGIELMKGSRT